MSSAKFYPQRDVSKRKRARGRTPRSPRLVYRHRAQGRKTAQHAHPQPVLLLRNRNLRRRVVGGLPCRSLCRYATNRQCDTGRILANGAACRCARASNLSQTRLLAKTDRQIVFNLRIALRYTPLYPNQRFGQRGKAASTAYKTQY